MFITLNISSLSEVKYCAFRRSKGSAGTPGGIAETLRNGSGPLAFIIGERDVNISIGTLVANRLIRSRDSGA